MLWSLHGLAEDQNVAFVATRLGIGYKVCCNGYMGRLSTTSLPDWLGTTKMAFVLTLVGI